MAEEKKNINKDKKSEEKISSGKEGAKTEEKKTDVKKSIPAVAKESVGKKKGTEEKSIEREYIIPLRRSFLKAPRYKRAKRAIKTIKEFLARHMRIENRDVRLVKIDRYLNEEIWFRGIKKPAGKVKVKAIKKDGKVYVELLELPEPLRFKKQKEEKREAEIGKVKAPKHEKVEEEKSDEEQRDEKEKEKASVEAGLARQEKEAKQQKHTAKGAHPKKTAPRRMSLKK